jgi:quinol monooxygenase YgiN
MYARATTVRGDAGKTDDEIAYVRDEVLPTLQQMSGCVGVSMMCDRDAGRCIITSAWADDTAMHASEQAAVDLRRRAAEVMGGEYETEVWEIALMHRKRDVPDGACTRVTWVRTDPARMDESIHTYRDRVVPAMEPWYGFCSVSALVDRDRGVASVAVTYENRESLELSRPEAMALREQITASTGAEVLDIAEFELALHHLRVPETV